MGDDGKPENEGDKKVVHVYPLIKVSWDCGAFRRRVMVGNNDCNN